METREDRGLGDRIRKNADYFDAPQGLRDRVDLLLTPARSKPAPGGVGRWLEWQRWWGMGAAFAMGVLLSVAVSSLHVLPESGDPLVGQVVDSHVRSLMVAHLSDVASSDQHTVKPWLSRQLDFSPPVRDLTADGFPLVGGRMDYIDHRAVAALVYQRQAHTINVFVWPLGGKSSGPSASTARQGFNIKSWDMDGMQFWAVSDLQSIELERFALLLRGQPGLRRLP
ncbi:MAG: anti-sigma factor [Rhodocyclales bacterium]|nr:anti-sigma factor [Rhodocyclales bacterium]